jgi:hypothetical protein
LITIVTGAGNCAIAAGVSGSLPPARVLATLAGAPVTSRQLLRESVGLVGSDGEGANILDWHLLGSPK